MAKRNIKLFDPKIGLEEEKTIVNVLKSKSWASGAGGKYVNQFEKKFKEKIKSSDCIAVNSGTIYKIRNEEIDHFRREASFMD